MSHPNPSKGLQVPNLEGFGVAIIPLEEQEITGPGIILVSWLGAPLAPGQQKWVAGQLAGESGAG